jgi:invasion protein IalB
MKRIFFTVFTCAFAIPVTIGVLSAQQGSPEPQLVYSPWARFCLSDNSACFLHTEGKAQSGSVASTVLLYESERPARKILRVTFPLGMSIQPGTRIVVDKDQPISAPYVVCPSNGCKADYQASASLIERLRNGRAIAVQGINGQGGAISLVVPLAGFAGAYDGPANDAQGFTLDEDLRGNAPRNSLPRSLTYSPWKKFCLTGKEVNAKEICFTGIDGRGADGIPIASVVLIEPTGEKKKTLRVTIPVGVSLPPGAQIKIGESKSISAPYVICPNMGCLADYPATAEMIAQLRSAKSVILESTQQSGQRNSYAFPLNGFAKAFDGAPGDSKVFEAQQKKLQDGLAR